MTSFLKSVTQRISLSFVALFLVVLLAACGGLGGMVSTPKPTATPAPVTYTGDGYTISYPKDWKESATDGQITFQDSLGNNAFAVVEVPNPNGVAQPSTVVDSTLAGGVKGSNLTKTSSANVPVTVTLACESWTQKGTTGTESVSGQSVQI